MFTTFIVQPIFNLLVFIYALLPGHNFGLALILFTIVIRLLLWPLVKKQLHHTKAIRALQPEIAKIKKATKGNRQKEQAMSMELYKERGINPLGAIPTLIVQLIVLFGLYIGLQRLLKDPTSITSFAYPALQNLDWLKQLSSNISLFDNSLFGLIDLSRPAISKDGGLYFGALLLVTGSAIAQYFQAKQLLPEVKEKRSLKAILRDAGQGKQADQSEVNEALSRGMIYLLPAMVFVFTVNLPAALSLYWLAGGIVALIQQTIVLRQDETEMEASSGALSGKDLGAIPEAEVVEVPAAVTNKPKKHASKGKAHKRRKK